MQIIKIYPQLIDHEKSISANQGNSFKQETNDFLAAGFQAPHILLPFYSEVKGCECFLSVYNYTYLQSLWAKENELPQEATLDFILEQQIKQFKPDVIYNLFTGTEIDDVLKKLSLKEISLLGWNFNAYNMFKADFSFYDKLLTSTEEEEVKKIIPNAVLAYPSVDSLMETSKEKANDIFIYGQFSNLHKVRNQLITDLLRHFKKSSVKIKLALIYKERRKPLINRFPFNRLGFLSYTYPKRLIRSKNTKTGYYGKALYSEIARSKIVISSIPEFRSHSSLQTKAPMRLFEGLGNCSLFLTEEGLYPKGITPMKDFVAYKDTKDFIEKITYYLENDSQREVISQNGYKTIHHYYSKEKQWERFLEIVNSLD